MTESRRSTSLHSSEFLPDRGPAEYFHGRTKILNDFNNLLKYASKKSWGTTVLIQGAPGVGKTALLHECGKLAKKERWHVANIKVTALWDKGKMLRSLGLGKMPKFESASAEVSLLDAFTGQISVSESARSTTSTDVVEKRKKPLLLILDEAQRLVRAGNYSEAQFNEAADLLESIHNGELKKPVILLAGGLGNTGRGFQALGISRFAEDCYVELGALSRESERAVIQDWLQKNGRAKGDTTAWINAIAQETHGWPQHIHSYAKRAANQLKADNGTMTAAGLRAALKAGQESRKVYYKQRISSFYGDQIQCLVNSVPDSPSGSPASRLEIMSSLTDKYGPSEAKELFGRFIEKGILEESGGGYAVPIPSMHTWLREEYV